MIWNIRLCVFYRFFCVGGVCFGNKEYVFERRFGSFKSSTKLFSSYQSPENKWFFRGTERVLRELARACSIPVGRRSGSRVAMTLVATINNILLARAFGVPAVGVRAVDCWQWRSGHYFHPYFLFFFFPRFFPFFFSPSRPFLIEGVLGSKNLFSESCLERPKT